MTAERAPEVEEVSEVVRALLRTERTFRTYPPGDPVGGRALAALEPRLGGLLPLDLEVRPDQLVWNEHPILSEGEPSELPGRLHRDGVRRLTLGEAVGLEELSRLLTCLSTRIEAGDPRRDYVTLLWEADLPNIRVVSVDPCLDLDVPDELLDGEAPTETAAASGQIEVPPAPEEAFRITGNDQQKAATCLIAAEQEADWPGFIAALFDVLDSAETPQRTADTATLIEQCFLTLLREDRFGYAIELQARMRGALPVTAVFPVRQALEELAHPDRLAIIEAALERGACTEDQASSLLLGFGDWAAESLCALLGRARGEHLRRFYVDLLVKIGPLALEPVLASLLHAQPETRSYFARVLGRIKDEGAKDALIACLRSEDPTLRREAVKGLAVQDDPSVRSRLWDVALADVEGSARIAALKAVIENRDDVDCARVVQRLESGDPKLLSEEEKDLLFRALGIGGGEVALDYIGRCLKGKWMAGRADVEVWRRATVALVEMGVPSAIDMLTSHAAGRGKLAGICQDALRRATVTK